MTTSTTYQHIVLDARGRPWIESANTKVVELVTKVRAHGWSPEELAYQLPHLTLGQIHSALAYYWDHRQELDDDVRRREEQSRALGQEAKGHPLVAKLRARQQI